MLCRMRGAMATWLAVGCLLGACSGVQESSRENLCGGVEPHPPVGSCTVEAVETDSPDPSASVPVAGPLSLAVLELAAGSDGVPDPALVTLAAELTGALR